MEPLDAFLDLVDIDQTKKLDDNRIKQIYGEKSKEEYQKDIWKDIKEINKNLVTYKHIKEIEITDIPMEKTTTQKIKRYPWTGRSDTVKMATLPK